MFAFLRVLWYVGVKKIGLVKKVLVLVSVNVLVSLHHIWCICESTLCNMNFKKKGAFVKHPNGHADYYVGKVLCAPRTFLIIIMIIRAPPITSCGASHKLVKICRRWFWATLLKPPTPLSTSVQYFFVIWMVISPKKVQSQSCQNKRKNKHDRQFWGGGCHVRRIPAVSSFQLFFCGTWRPSKLLLVRILEVGWVRGK